MEMAGNIVYIQWYTPVGKNRELSLKFPLNLNIRNPYLNTTMDVSPSSSM